MTVTSPGRRAPAPAPPPVTSTSTSRGCREQRRQAREVADVVPLEGGGHDDDATGIRRRLGHRVVDGDLGQAGPGRVEQRRISGDGPQPTRELGVPLLEQVEQRGSTHHEHPCVPTELTRGHIGSRALGIRLLDELEHAQRGGRPGQGHPRADVAEPGRGPGGLDADGDEVSLTGHRRRLADHRLERRLVGDDVVGRERADHGIRVETLDDGGGEPDGGHRVARRRLRQHVRGAQPRQLRPHGRGVRRPGDHDHPVGGERLEPVDGRLQQRAAAAGEVEEELGVAGPAQRPQPGAGATGGDDGPEAGDAGHRVSLRARSCRRLARLRRGRGGRARPTPPGRSTGSRRATRTRGPGPARRGGGPP